MPFPGRREQTGAHRRFHRLPSKHGVKLSNRQWGEAPEMGLKNRSLLGRPSPGLGVWKFKKLSHRHWL